MANLAIIVPGVNLRASASINAAALRMTSAVTLASVFGVSHAPEADGNLWIEIRTEDGLEAWVRADKVWRVFGDFSLLGGSTYDTPVAGVVAFPPTSANNAQVPAPPAAAPQAPPASAEKWTAPLAGYVVTEPFGGPTGHLGIDLAAPLGTPVYNRAAGKVYTADDCPACANGNGAVKGTSDPRTNYGFGVNVVVRHAYADLPDSARRAMDAANCAGGWLFVRYAHLQKRFVSAAQDVKAGDLLGWEGTSGNSSGPHCHVELRGWLIQQPPNVFNGALLDPNVLFAL